MKKDYYFALAILGFMIGGSIPLIATEAEPERLWSVYFGPMLILGASLFRRIGRKMHKMANWATSTKQGVFALTLTFSFFISGTAALLSLLAMPKWAHITLVSVIGLVAFGFFIADIMKATETK